MEKPILTGLAGTFEYMGPAATLIRHLKYSNRPDLARGAAAYMAAQFLNLNWPIPDLIVPVPISFTHWIDRGYNQSELLSKTLSSILGCPIKNALGRKSGDFSQAGLSRQQRLLLNGQSIYLKKNQNLHDLNILLVDDVITTATTMKKCASALLENAPSTVYGLSFCR